MVFRDDREAQQLRVEALERELDDARLEIQKLRGNDLQTASKPGFAGGPFRDEVEQTIAGELSDEGRELIVEELRRRYGRTGQVSQVGRSLTWSIEPTQNQPARNLQFTITSRHGRTRIRAIERNGGLAGGIYGGVGGGAGLGLGSGLVVASGLTLGAAIAIQVALLWLVIIFFGSRAIFNAAVRARQRELRAAMASITELAEEEISATGGAVATNSEGRTRVRAEVNSTTTKGVDSDEDEAMVESERAAAAVRREQG